MEPVIQAASLFTSIKSASHDSANNNTTTLLWRETDCAKLKDATKTIISYLQHPKGKVI